MWTNDEYVSVVRWEYIEGRLGSRDFISKISPRKQVLILTL